MTSKMKTVISKPKGPITVTNTAEETTNEKQKKAPAGHAGASRTIDDQHAQTEPSLAEKALNGALERNWRETPDHSYFTSAGFKRLREEEARITGIEVRGAVVAVLAQRGIWMEPNDEIRLLSAQPKISAIETGNREINEHDVSLVAVIKALSHLAILRKEIQGEDATMNDDEESNKSGGETKNKVEAASTSSKLASSHKRHNCCHTRSRH